MTEQQPSPSPDPAEAYAAEYRRLWDATVATLTAAVQLDHPEHGAVDFSDFLASALGAVEPALRHSQDDPIHAAPLAA